MPSPPAASSADGAAAPTVCITADMALSGWVAAAHRRRGSGVRRVLLHAAAGELRAAAVPHAACCRKCSEQCAVPCYDVLSRVSVSEHVKLLRRRRRLSGHPALGGTQSACRRHHRHGWQQRQARPAALAGRATRRLFARYCFCRRVRSDRLEPRHCYQHADVTGHAGSQPSQHGVRR